MQNDRYPQAYERFLYEFHVSRDYFECHELLEDYWKNHPQDGYGQLWVGLIQLAVGSYHHRRDNQQGALKMFLQARKRLHTGQLTELGLDGEALLSMIEARIAALERGEAFTDLSLPFMDTELLVRLQDAAADSGRAWAAPSAMEAELVHRHKLRDRSEVIAARAAALEAGAFARRSRPLG